MQEHCPRGVRLVRLLPSDVGSIDELGRALGQHPRVRFVVVSYPFQLTAATAAAVLPALAGSALRYRHSHSRQAGILVWRRACWTGVLLLGELPAALEHSAFCKQNARAPIWNASCWHLHGASCAQDACVVRSPLSETCNRVVHQLTLHVRATGGGNWPCNAALCAITEKSYYSPMREMSEEEAYAIESLKACFGCQMFENTFDKKCILIDGEEVP